MTLHQHRGHHNSMAGSDLDDRAAFVALNKTGYPLNVGYRWTPSNRWPLDPETERKGAERMVADMYGDDDIETPQMIAGFEVGTHTPWAADNPLFGMHDRLTNALATMSANAESDAMVRDVIALSGHRPHEVVDRVMRDLARLREWLVFAAAETPPTAVQDGPRPPSPMDTGRVVDPDAVAAIRLARLAEPASPATPVPHCRLCGHAPMRVTEAIHLQGGSWKCIDAAACQGRQARNALRAGGAM